MVAFGHTAVGAIVGITTYQFSSDIGLSTAAGLVVSGTVGVISHYLADLIPHGHFFRHQDYQKKVKYAIVFDLLASILLFTILSWARFGFGQEFWFILFGIGGAQLPDIIDGLYYTKRLKPNLLLDLELNIHQSTHWHGKLNKALLWGKRDIWQITVVLIALFLLIF